MRAFCLFFALCLFSLPAWAAAPVVLEFFTSEECTDAPPAEEVFSKILQENKGNTLITLRCPVSYFAPKDTAPPKFCDARHRLYKDLDRQLSLKIPQIVINGRFPTGGTNEKIVGSGIAMAHSLNELHPLQIRRRTPGHLEIALPVMDLPKAARLYLFFYDDTTKTVQDIRDMGLWSGSAQSLVADVPSDLEITYALIAQNSEGKIIAAGKAD